MKKNFLLLIVIFLILLATILLFISNKESEERIYCEADQRNADFCIEIYQPVCGFVNVECVTDPCPPDPQTFPNSCFACMNERVDYYLEGECNV